MQKNSYKAGETIFEEGQESDAFYLILDGRVEVMLTHFSILTRAGEWGVGSFTHHFSGNL